MSEKNYPDTMSVLRAFGIAEAVDLSNPVIAAKVDAFVKAQLRTSATARAEQLVADAVRAGLLKNDTALRSKWVQAMVRDEAGTTKLLASVRQRQPRGVEPIASGGRQLEDKELTGLARVAAAFREDFSGRNF